MLNVYIELRIVQVPVGTSTELTAVPAPAPEGMQKGITPCTSTARSHQYSPGPCSGSRSPAHPGGAGRPRARVLCSTSLGGCRPVPVRGSHGRSGAVRLLVQRKLPATDD